MKLLLDTQLLLFAAGQPKRLSTLARKLLNDTNNELLFSAASLWEVTIKHSLGREDFRVEPRVLRRGLLAHGAVPILRLRNRRDELSPTTCVENLLSRLPARIQFPVPRGTRIGRVKDWAVEERVGHNHASG